MTVPVRLLPEGGSSALNLTTGTNLFTGVGAVYRVIVVVTAAAASSVIDSAGTSATSANTLLTIPASTLVGTVYYLAWPVVAGLSIVPGSGVTLAVSYSSGLQG
jgi:hypothetical protein